MNLKGKKVAVFGVGASGVSAIKLLHREGARVTAVNKGKAKEWPNYKAISEILSNGACFDQEEAIDHFPKCDLIILSPGIPREHPVLEPALKSGVPIWSEIELGYRFAPNLPIVALTGTNGKTTTVTMIGEALSLAGKKPFVGGNIGVPFCEMTLGDEKYDSIILELSSFQLESMVSFRPNIAVFLNIFQNHGERYSDIADYFESKAHITDCMEEEDHLIYSSDYSMIEMWAENQKIEQHPIPSDNSEMLRGNLASNYSLEKFKLPGPHNISNLYFASKVCELLGATEGFQKMIDTFCGVPHRVQFVETKLPFIAYNDAKSTNWDATKVAVSAIEKKDRELYLILGGQKRGRADSLLPHLEILKEKVDKFILIGDTMEMFASELKGKADFEVLTDLPSVITHMEQEDFKGVLLLSPAFPSYDQYKNYIKRGEHFIELLNSI